VNDTHVLPHLSDLLQLAVGALKDFYTPTNQVIPTMPTKLTLGQFIGARSTDTSCMIPCSGRSDCVRGTIALLMISSVIC